MGTNPRVTVITGASSGIGLEAAKLFAARGDALVLAARRADRLQKIAAELTATGCDVLLVPIDLSQTDQSPELIARTMERFGRIDVLVNNAGFAVQQLFERMSDEHIEEIFRVNVLTPLVLARRIIPIMQAQGGGSIINVSSVAGLLSSPMSSTYSATKYALIGFSKSLRQELYHTGVRVTVVCPGNTNTEFFDLAAQGYEYLPLLTKYAASPVDIARSIVWASNHNREIVIPSFQAKLLYYFGKYFPGLYAWSGTKYRGMVEKITAQTRSTET